MITKATRLIVKAGVRYWEDSRINGTEDEQGTLVPLRKGDHWCPILELATGRVLDWPAGVNADIYYKVCDDGEYWLANDSNTKLAKYGDDIDGTSYVPDAFLCVGDRGYGDYIILNVGADGLIVGWKPPVIDPREWVTL